VNSANEVTEIGRKRLVESNERKAKQTNGTDISAAVERTTRPEANREWAMNRDFMSESDLREKVIAPTEKSNVSNRPGIKRSKPTDNGRKITRFTVKIKKCKRIKSKSSKCDRKWRINCGCGRKNFPNERKAKIPEGDWSWSERRQKSKKAKIGIQKRRKSDRVIQVNFAFNVGCERDAMRRTRKKVKFDYIAEVVVCFVVQNEWRRTSDQGRSTRTGSDRANRVESREGKKGKNEEKRASKDNHQK
jgi:hypothetical protein